MNWWMKIERVDNGYVLSMPEELEGEDNKAMECIRQILCEDEAGELGEKKAMRKALWEILGYFNVNPTHHEPCIRIRIEDENGGGVI